MAKKDTKKAKAEPVEKNQEVPDVVEIDDALDEDIPEEVYEEDHDDTHDEEHENLHEHGSLSSSILRVLAILLIGAAAALWAGPKLAPILPAGLKPVADFLSPQTDITEQVTALKADFSKRLAAIEAANNALDITADIAPELARLAAKDAEIDAALATLAKATNALDVAIATLQSEVTEVTALQAMSAQGGQASDQAIQQFEGKLAAISAAQLKLNKSQLVAVEAQQNAEDKLRLADATNAVSGIANALKTGKPFQNELGQLSGTTGIEIPSELADIAKTGAPSLTDLKKQLPELSRIVLRENAAANTENDIAGKFAAFLKSQVGTRSLEPQQGNDMDAVLSRMEASLDADDLENTLAETSNLNDAAQQTMTDWIADLAQLNSAQKSLHAVQQQLSAAQR